MQNVKTYILLRLLGAFEIIIFMKQGLKRFDGTAKETLLSFSILLITMPLSYLATDIKKPLGAEDFSTNYIYFVGTVISVVSFVVSLLLLFAFAKYVTKNTKKIWLFYTIFNWVVAVFIPIAILLYYLKFNEMLDKRMVEDINIFLTLYGYVIAGFVIYRIFNPPWELAAAFACGILVIDQVIYDLIFTIAGIPIVDYMEVFG